jgi:hypothetical protein
MYIIEIKLKKSDEKVKKLMFDKTSPFVSILNFSTYVKDFKQFISGLTFARGSNQPFISNAIVFLSSSRADIFRLFGLAPLWHGLQMNSLRCYSLFLIY